MKKITRIFGIGLLTACLFLAWAPAASAMAPPSGEEDPGSLVLLGEIPSQFPGQSVENAYFTLTYTNFQTGLFGRLNGELELYFDWLVSPGQTVAVFTFNGTLMLDPGNGLVVPVVFDNLVVTVTHTLSGTTFEATGGLSIGGQAMDVSNLGQLLHEILF